MIIGKSDKKSRPLIQDDLKKNMSIIYDERYKLYENCAKYTIDTTTLSTTQVADEIIQCIN
jgi:shikimate kinase